MQSCEVCSASDKLFQCARCRRAFYCSKEHQRLHWKEEHKVRCNVLVGDKKKQQQQQKTQKGKCELDDHRQLVERFAQQLSTDESVHSHQNHQVVLTAATDHDRSSSGQMRDTVQEAASVAGLADVVSARGGGGGGGAAAAAAVKLNKNAAEEVVAGASASALTPLYPPPYLHRNARPSSVTGSSFSGGCVNDASTLIGVNSPGWVHTMSQYVVRDLDSHGICVIDNFVGNHLGSAILSEVLDMYESGQFVDGKLMSNSSENMSRAIRGDKIHWVTGQEAHCKSIGHLVRLVDSVVINGNRMSNNGKLGQYTITDRTKAMVACYPGGGAAYVKHVDNPNKDGRCVTAIYYLNKNWDVKKDGGLLRIFPRDWPQVADIEPVFDRILFFWSDRRNPHEVQPALRTRYAITLWYQDKQERELKALKNNVE